MEYHINNNEIKYSKVINSPWILMQNDNEYIASRTLLVRNYIKTFLNKVKPAKFTHHSKCLDLKDF